MCSGSEAGSYLRPIDFVYHSSNKEEEELDLNSDASIPEADTLLGALVQGLGFRV